MQQKLARSTKQKQEIYIGSEVDADVFHYVVQAFNKNKAKDATVLPMSRWAFDVIA